MADRTIVAQIPTGQPIDLFAAVGGLLDAALDGALIGAGDGRAVAGSIILPDDVDVPDAITRLRTATRALGATPIDTSEDTAGVGTVGPIREHPDGGLTLGIGGVGEQARKLAAVLLTAFIPALNDAGAPNYLEFPAVDQATGDQYAVIVCRPGGTTPHQARRRAEDALRTLARHVDETGHRYRTGVSLLRPIRAGVDCAADCRACQLLADMPADLLDEVRAQHTETIPEDS